MLLSHVQNTEMNLSEGATVTTSWKPENQNANILIEWYNTSTNSCNLSILIHMQCGNKRCFMDAVQIKIRNNETTGMLPANSLKGKNLSCVSFE